MNRVQSEINPNTDYELERMIEPLVGYICATDRPRAALLAALAALFQEVEQTNKAASVQLATFSEDYGS